MEIIYELIDLASDIILNIEQQLSYYKVSVYKNEEASKINESVEDLKQIIDVIQDEDMREAFLDYEATAENHLFSPTGESCFYVRTLKLVSTLSEIIRNYSQSSLKRDRQDLSLSRALSFQKNKNSLLSRYHRQPRSFFQDI